MAAVGITGDLGVKADLFIQLKYIIELVMHREQQAKVLAP